MSGASATFALVLLVATSAPVQGALLSSSHRSAHKAGLVAQAKSGLRHDILEAARRGGVASTAAGQVEVRARMQSLLQGATHSAQSVGTVPTADDTLPGGYFVPIDAAINEAQARLTTTVPPPNASSSGYQAVLGAQSGKNGISATDLTAEELANAQVVRNAVGPSAMEAANALKKVPLLPYDMKIGAEILSRVSQESTSTAPPSQFLVSQQFVAQCPMIMFANTLGILAPKCGQSQGLWKDPTSGRTILRWQGLASGTVRFGVDSVVTGDGSVPFATSKQQFALNGNNFDLMDCLDVKLWKIEEQVVQVDQIGAGVTSSIQNHDVSQTGVAFFYKYLIIAPNGTTVATSSLFRLGQDTFNVSMIGDETSLGPLVATATRSGGTWTQDEWTACTNTDRGWTVSFLMSSRDFNTVATVMDLRVATAAMVTLAAFRAQAVNTQTGVNRTGEINMMWVIVRSVLYVALAIACFILVLGCFKRSGGDTRARRFCFKVEKVCLPASASLIRTPAFNSY